MVISIIILALFIIGLLWSLYMLWDSHRMLHRNEEVYAFSMLILNIGSNYCRRHILAGDEDALDAYDWFVHKWTYSDLLHSRKPLTLEKWYSEEEIKKINS